jgi:hypothetical protein
MKLVWPAAEYLSGYINALEQGWSPDNRRPEAAQEELARIADDPGAILAEQIDREAKGPKVILPDGRQVPASAGTIPKGCGMRRILWLNQFSLAPRNDVNFRRTVWVTSGSRSFP